MQILKSISFLFLIQFICLAAVVNSFAQHDQIVFKLKEDAMDSYCITPFALCSEFESALQLSFTLNNKTAIAYSEAAMTFTAKVDSNDDMQEVIDQMMSTGKFKYVESDFIAEPLATNPTPTLPTDSNFSKQWAFKNEGDHETVYSVEDADIDMEYAWSLQQGSQNVTVAILDTGVDYTHPDLKNRMWTNDLEIPDNGIDDDNNGYIDDVKGYDFAESDNDPMDVTGHGTHVAGIVGAQAGNGTGFTGVDWNCKLMALKVITDNSTSNYSDYAAAIYYAVAQGAKVINLSLTSYNPSTVIEDAFSYAYSQGVVIVVAMANDGNTTVHYMAQSPYSIAVGATTPSDRRASFSNFNSYIDVVAPGTFIFGLNRWNHQDDYNIQNGTSQAAPLVSGLASLLFAQDMTRTPDQIRQIIQLTAEDQVGPAHEDLPGHDNHFGFGRINAFEALSYSSNQNENITFHGEASSDSSCQQGAVCDDNNSCTVNDIITADCECKGTFEDKDNDGICAIEDVDDWDACIPNARACDKEILACRLVNLEGFENRRSFWVMNGDNARIEERLSSSGRFSVRIEANNRIASSIRTRIQDYSRFEQMTVSFNYQATNMRAGEEFLFEVSVDGGNTFTVLESWAARKDFRNDRQEHGTVFIPKDFLGPQNIFRFRCMARLNSGGIHLDEISIEECRGQASQISGLSNLKLEPEQNVQSESLEMIAFPNPTIDQITLDHQIFSTQETEVLIYTQMGKTIYHCQFSVVDEVKIDVSAFHDGMYYVKVVPTQSTSSFSTSFFKH